MLFKITDAGRKQSVFIKAESLSEILNHRGKLGLDESTECKVFYDGCQIPDDEVLNLIFKDAASILTLSLVPADTPLTPPPPVANKPLTPPAPADSTEANGSQEIAVCQADEPTRKAPLPIGRFSGRLRESLKNGTRPTTSDRISMVNTIADYMIYELKDTERGTAALLAQEMVAKYPNSLADSVSLEADVGAAIIGTGSMSLFHQIYNRVNYAKPDSLKKKRKKRTSKDGSSSTDAGVDNPVELLSSSSEDEDSCEAANRKKTDEYGCVSFEPPLPPDEDSESQERKRAILLTQSLLVSDDDKLVKELMEETFPSQRIAINRRKGLIVEVINLWPYLKEAQYFANHARILMDRDFSQAFWIETLSKKSTDICAFIKSRLLKLKPNKDPAKNKPTTNKMIGIFNELKKISKSDQTQTSTATARAIAIFPLIIYHFDENVDLFFQLVETLEESEDSRNICETPVLLVKGLSVFDPEAKCAVFVEGKLCVECNSVLNGFLMCFLTYYVYNLQYPAELKSTLEFIQRLLLNINPTTGSKQSSVKGRNKRTKVCDWKVLSFANGLKDHSSMWTVD